jgi:hypothetical protein
VSVTVEHSQKNQVGAERALMSTPYLLEPSFDRSMQHTLSTFMRTFMCMIFAVTHLRGKDPSEGLRVTSRDFKFLLVEVLVVKVGIGVACYAGYRAINQPSIMMARPSRARAGLCRAESIRASPNAPSRAESNRSELQTGSGQLGQANRKCTTARALSSTIRRLCVRSRSSDLNRRHLYYSAVMEAGRLIYHFQFFPLPRPDPSPSRLQASPAVGPFRVRLVLT